MEVARQKNLNNPYLGLADKSFWKKAIVEKTPTTLNDIYTKKFSISQSDRIATAGSCFAQHVSRSLKSNGFKVINKESSDYSANYGNIYTVAQLLQLTKESIGTIPITDIAWDKEGGFIDALRPGAITSPLESSEDVSQYRLKHLHAVRTVLKELDVFIFTLGLTEAWIRVEDQVVFPSAPGVIAGEFNPELFEFKNYEYNSIVTDFKEFIATTKAFRQGRPFKTILTVSPVPLTATASGKHILVANTYSKATLRTVAATLSEDPLIDYFPSYEIVTNPRYHLDSYNSNLRTVKQSTVKNVMTYFFSEHCPFEYPQDTASDSFDVQCEEQILEMYSNLQADQAAKTESLNTYHTEIIGDSHMNSLVKAIRSTIGNEFTEQYCVVDRRTLKNGINPINAIQPEDIGSFVDDGSAKNKKLVKFTINAKKQVEKFKHSNRTRLLIVGNLMGDNFLRLHGTFTERDSPNIPIISDISEISDTYQAKVTAQIIYAKELIQKALTCFEEKDIRWIVSPLPSESCATLRFGIDYLRSRSQVVYNNYVDNLLEDILGGYIQSGIVLTQPNTTISDTGFTHDRYAFMTGTDDIHLNESYYKEFIANALPD